VIFLCLWYDPANTAAHIHRRRVSLR
jgi:hypothetical protein